jgi:hypothetical protein
VVASIEEGGGPEGGLGAAASSQEKTASHYRGG